MVPKKCLLMGMIGLVALVAFAGCEKPATTQPSQGSIEYRSQKFGQAVSGTRLTSALQTPIGQRLAALGYQPTVYAVQPELSLNAPPGTETMFWVYCLATENVAASCPYDKSDKPWLITIGLVNLRTEIYTLLKVGEIGVTSGDRRVFCAFTPTTDLDGVFSSFVLVHGPMMSNQVELNSDTYFSPSGQPWKCRAISATATVAATT